MAYKTKEKQREAYKLWWSKPENKEKKKLYARRDYVKEKRKTYYREWYKKKGRFITPEQSFLVREWARKNPEKISAHSKLNYAIKKGVIIKDITCNRCNRETRLHAHHPDYSKPLQVKWLCSSCHKLIHNS